MTLLATPFHARAAEANRLNAWMNRGGFTLASDYGDAAGEAVAARFGAVLADLSWLWRVKLTGPRAAEFVSRFFTRDASALAPGAGLRVLWLNDAGAVRGAGTIARLGRESFLLVAPMEDADWLTNAARLYDVAAADVTSADGILAVVGPASRRILERAGLNAAMEPVTLKKLFWRGLDVTLSRFALGYEVWCEPDVALIAWDRLTAAGRCDALRPAGQRAMDILALESGLLRPVLDYAPARDGFAPEPTPQSLGLGALVDRGHFFNGKRGFLAAGADTVLSGLLLDGETPVPNAPVMHEGRQVGRTLVSLYSPALRGAAALAVFAAPPPERGLMAGGIVCRAVALPLLPIPAPIAATENPSSTV